MSSTERLRLRCPACHKTVAVPAQFVGKTVVCPNPACRKSVVLETLPTPAPRVEPAPLTAEAPRTSLGPWLVVAGLAGVFTLLTAVAIGAGIIVYLTRTPKTAPAPPDVPQAEAAPPNAPAADGPAENNPAESTGAEGAARPQQEVPPGTTPKGAVPTVAAAPPAADPEPADLPSFGPLRAPAGDPVAQHFKLVRASYLAELKLCRDALGRQSFDVQKKISDSDLDPAEKARVLKQLNDEGWRFGLGEDLFYHPAMQGLMAEYHRKTAAAAAAFAAQVEKGLAQYAAAGETDPAKLTPLRAEQKALKYRDLVGTWELALPRPKHRLVWVVDVDRAADAWRVDCVEWKDGGVAHYFGEQITFKDDVFALVAARQPSRATVAGIPWSFEERDKLPRIPVTLAWKDGQVQYRESGKQPPAKLRRTGDERSIKSVAYEREQQGQKDTPRPKTPAAPALDLADHRAVWYELAELASFAHYPGTRAVLPAHQRLFLPYRGNNFTPAGAGLTAQTDDLLRRADRLTQAAHPYLRRAADAVHARARARLQLAVSNDRIGNTPTSSVRDGFDLIRLGFQYTMSRQADQMAVEDTLRRQYPNHIVTATNVPFSEESQQRLDALVARITNLRGDINQKSEISGLLGYADMAEADRLAAVWEKTLLPLARRAAAPPGTKPLVGLQGGWAGGPNRERFQRLSTFLLRNVAGQELTHVVVAVVAENEWGEKVGQYYYLPSLDPSQPLGLIPHPRWEKRRLDFTNTLTVTYSVWSDQGSEVGRPVKLASPAPNPDPAGWRKDYLAFDAQYQVPGEALGAVIRATTLLPTPPDVQRRRTLAAAAAGTGYAFRAPGAETLKAIHFVRADADGATVEAEVSDLGDRKPLLPQSPVWKGQLGSEPRGGFVIRFDTGWAFLLSPDDRPQLVRESDGRSADGAKASAMSLLPINVR